MLRYLSLWALVLFTLAATACSGAALSPEATAIPPATIQTIPVSGAASVPAPATIVASSTTPATVFSTLTPLATSTQTGGGTLDTSSLKYMLLARFGPIFFCDPDYYPVAREIPPDEIERRVEQVRQNSTEYAVILQRLGLDPATTLTPEQVTEVYAEFKKLNAIPLTPSADGYDFSLRIGEEDGAKGQGTAITGKIDAGGNITVTGQQPAFLTCPICLAAGTRIDTPDGLVPVEDIRPGLMVWTMTSQGLPLKAQVVKTVRRPLGPGATLLRITLADSRSLTVSPWHPLPDGRPISSITVGDTLDGSRVMSIAAAPAGEATFDLLPDGETGTYRANGIWLSSTLKRGPEGIENATRHSMPR